MLRLAFLFASSLVAQDFYWLTTSPRSIGMGGVFAPGATTVADSLAANPAGLGAISRTTVELNLSSFFARGQFSNIANNKSPMTLAPAVMPFGGVATAIGNTGLRLGFGIVPELTAVSQWNYTDAPGTAGVTYGAQKQKAAIVAARLATSIAFNFSSSFIVGFTYGRVYNSNQLVTPYIFQSHPALRGLKTLLDLNTEGYGNNYSIGVMARPRRNMQFGFSWKSNTTIHSTGRAAGNVGLQLAALGITNFEPAFRYDAAVRNRLPQSLLLHSSLQFNPRLLLALQGSWVNWRDAFITLPVALTNGANSDLNSLLNSTAINDGIPLDWNNRFQGAIGIEYSVLENTRLRTGFATGNNPVPSSTLSPLTAAIARHQWTGGLGWRKSRFGFDLAYAFGFNSTARVGRSALLAGEYANSTTRIGIQSFSLGFQTFFF